MRSMVLSIGGVKNADSMLCRSVAKVRRGTTVGLGWIPVRTLDVATSRECLANKDTLAVAARGGIYDVFEGCR